MVVEAHLLVLELYETGGWPTLLAEIVQLFVAMNHFLEELVLLLAVGGEGVDCNWTCVYIAHLV